MAEEIKLSPSAHDCWPSKASQSPGATENKNVSSGRGELIAKIGTVVSAIMASSCCWLPPLLILAGVSGAGMTQALETYRPVFMVVTFGFLGTAFYLTYRPRPAANATVEDCCAPAASRGKWRFSMMTMNKIMLWGVTAVAVVFLFFPQVVTGLFSEETEFTADMTRTVFRVEGMTCAGWELKAETAIRTAPGVLAVKADYRAGTATIGTRPGEVLSTDAILAALESIGYRGEFVEP